MYKYFFTAALSIAVFVGAVFLAGSHLPLVLAVAGAICIFVGLIKFNLNEKNWNHWGVFIVGVAALTFQWNEGEYILNWMYYGLWMIAGLWLIWLGLKDLNVID